MKKKTLCIISVILVALSLCFFASCNGYNGCGKKSELKSSAGVTLTGGNFGKKAKLITEKVEMTEENVKSTIDKLPEEFKLLADEKMATIDISVESGGVKVQPDGKVRVSVPAPIEGVEEYLVFHIKSESTVERLDCEFKDGKVVFETDSFSPFVFLDNSNSSALVIKNPGPCEGTVVVSSEIEFIYGLEHRVIDHIIDKIYSGEEKTIYSKANKKLNLSVECGYDYVLGGWFMEKDGEIESTPFSTESRFAHKTVAGTTTIVCKFKADLTDMESIWAFPGTSNMPKGYTDGRAATSVYIKPGNQTGIDLSKLIIKGKKRKDFRLVYTLLAPEQFVVSGLDEIDYSKEGEYRVEYKVRVSDEKVLTLVITVYVSEKNSDITVKAGKGGQFYIEEKYDVYTEKQLIFTDKDQKYSITAVPDRDFEFDGWYRWYAGGVLGDRLSENPTYEVGMSDYDLNIIAMFKIKPEKSNLKTDVYQLHHWVGESGLPRVYRKGVAQLEAQNVLYYKPGTPETDFLKLDERGLRRKDNPTDNDVYEHVQLFFGDYSIDYGGLDFNKEGVYYMKYTVHFSRINKAMEDVVYNAFYVYVSEQFAHLTVELTGKGSIAEKNNEFSEIKTSNDPLVLNYFALGNNRVLLAKPAEGYKFAGWYSVDEEGNLSEEPVSTEAEYEFRQNGADVHIKALFVEEIDWLTLECEGFEGGFFHYSLSSKKQADLTGLTVTTDKGNVLDASEYVVDASKVDYTKTGDHEITVTYKYDKAVKATLMVNVPKAETYSYLLDRDGTQGVIQKDGKVVVHTPDGHREEVDLGGTLTLTAVANEGYKFAGWYITNSAPGSGSDEEARFYSSNAEETFAITDNTYIFARFVEKEKATLTVIAGEHGNIYNNNIEGYSPAEKQLQFVVHEGSKVKVSASGETVYFKFLGWYDGEGETAALISDKDVVEFTVTEDATVYARFDYAFIVSARIESEGAGEFVGEGVTENGFYVGDLPNNASVTVEVKPNAGYRFIGWFTASDSAGYNADELLSKDLKYTFNVSEETGNVHLTAMFRGAVTELKLDDLSDFGFDTDGNGNPEEEYVFNLNSEHWVDFEHVTVLGKVGNKYERLCHGLEYSVESTIGVSENNMLDTSKAGVYTVTYTYLANPALKAVINIRIVEEYNFLAQCYEYNWGYITENGKKVDFGNGRHVEKGTRITLTAVANEGYDFLGWYFYSEQQAETLISEKETCTFTVNRELYVFAKFAQKVMHLFNAYVAPYNGGRITENGKPVEFGNGRPVEAGAQITLTAVANEGFTFVGWYKSVDDQTEELISSDATYTFTVNERTHVYAKFDEKK
ncbi:MAG: InlB B-repeat-containing protein [Clostridiales bacterium]|nr:InlB B-repeat-containing protein [Clostridiales bacterium]